MMPNTRIGPKNGLENSALLVIDMQEHFRPIGAKIVSELNATIEAYRKHGLPVIFTKHGHKNVELDSGQLGKFWGYQEMIKYGSKQWQLLPELNVYDTDYKIIEKRRYDAFHGTMLEEVLRSMEVEIVVIAGVMTNLCCETTARVAFCRDFRVLFLSDGTATCNQQLHECTLQNIAYGFGQVLTCKELREEIGKK